MLRRDAVSAGHKRYFTGKKCPKGHIADRLTSNSTCVVCLDIKARAWLTAKRPEARVIYKRHVNKDIEGFKKKRRVYYENNKDSLSARSKEWAKANLKKSRSTKAAWKRRNPEYSAADRARRAAAQLSATPSWADVDAIILIYRECAKISAATGIKHHVDHMIPLRGKNVCGLHVPWNLQILEAAANISKGNRFMDEAA